MHESEALQRIQQGDEAALIFLMDRYAAYVSTVIFHILGPAGSAAEVEETASDVFLALWHRADQVHPGKLKAYLSGVARNKAREKARSRGRELPLEEDLQILSPEDPARELEDRELAEFLRRAVLAMGRPDREIFLRHYYYCQTVAQIAAELDMPVSTVKTRLRRGRETLKRILQEGGYDLAAENF